MHLRSRSPLSCSASAVQSYSSLGCVGLPVAGPVQGLDQRIKGAVESEFELVDRAAEPLDDLVDGNLPHVVQHEGQALLCRQALERGEEDLVLEVEDHGLERAAVPEHSTTSRRALCLAHRLGAHPHGGRLDVSHGGPGLQGPRVRERRARTR